MFEVGGKCLAYHGPLLYEAKILRRWNPKLEKVEYSVPLKSGEEDGLPESMNREEFYYYIHYQGWKSSWDEWVSVDRIMELTEANIELKKQLVMEAKKASLAQQQKTKNGGSAKRGGGGAHSESNHGGRRSGSGDRRDSNAEQRGIVPSEGPFRTSSVMSYNFSRNKLRIHIPMILESMLVDDWEIVTKEKKISNLPNPFPVETILDRFYKDVATRTTSPVELSLVEEYVYGLKQYFNEAIGNLLLYKLERLQYEQVFYPTPEQQQAMTPVERSLSGRRPGQLYGVLHLLRLISILPEMLSNCVGMDTQAINVILRHTEKLLLWLMDRIEDLLPHKVHKSYYTNTSSQYEGVALGL